MTYTDAGSNGVDAADDLVVGGVVPLSSRAYVTRDFESQCLRYLTAGDWVTLVGPRQHGKSSGLIRVKAALEESGYAVAVVDLQDYPLRSTGGVDVFYEWLARRLRRRFGLATASTSPEASDDLELVLEYALKEKAQEPKIVIIDEVTSLERSVLLTFFSQLRALHTATRGGLSDIGRSCQFLFAGTFRPDTVIDDDNSPFNVSRILQTSDLSVEEVTELATSVLGSNSGGVTWAEKIHQEVGGQPYLVQKFLELVGNAAPDGADNAFAAGVMSLASGHDPHVATILRQTSSESGADELLERVLQTGEEGLVTSDVGLGRYLEIVGAAAFAERDGVPVLSVRNALYARVFRSTAKLSPEAALEQPESVEAPLIVVPLVHADLQWIDDEALRQIVADQHAAAVILTRNASFRLALSALGGAYEGMLLAFLEQMDEATRNGFKRAVRLRNNSRVEGPVRRWTFEALVAVAHQSGALFDVSRASSDLVRDWRNYIHPNKARENYRPEVELRSDVRMMDVYVEKLLQSMNQS